ncbi:MAG: cryptochrome/photolyase family protein [Candidatus Obscuribacter phosphatis]|uniref:Cryptochrome/photolyase family protein n=1 Tax=Candidatus Obscuribacter phosphatis TaxID=1906157 RepID=A0A8J7PKX9_9BACT|nr:cryptochrome/photolyase family protein [Candidatus Obscuribacter phosphatis]
MTSLFKNELAGLSKEIDYKSKRTWFYLPYDQVTNKIGPLSRLPSSQAGVILIENAWKPSLRPYHKQKLALVLANMRNFALELAGQGVAVEHMAVSGHYSQALKEMSQKYGQITMMEAAEYELRRDLAGLQASGALQVVRHEGWLTELEDLKGVFKSGKFRMDAFYRHLRQKTGILMEANKPIGGKYSFDSENRLPWKGIPPAPSAPCFAPNAVTEEVGYLIEKYFADHPGKLNLETLPATAKDAEKLWRFAKEECLPHFGPYEDAMSTKSSGLFHTRLSQLLNIMRILPQDILQEVLEMDIPLASKEGFIRQVIGWREYVRGMHALTDGFRNIKEVECREKPGDAGYSKWLGRDFGNALYKEKSTGSLSPIDGGAAPNYLASKEALPQAFWGTPSGLNCLDVVVKDVMEEAYSHHITRLMILSNLATLLDIEPRELTDWFWVAYSDAYDWVVEPNVLAMGTFALGELMTTKPYVSGAAYINKMSDYCKGCRFDPAKNCPVTRLYWAFLDRKADKLKGNQRMMMPLNSLKKRSEAEKEKDRALFQKVKTRLSQGLELD